VNELSKLGLVVGAQDVNLQDRCAFFLVENLWKSSLDMKLETWVEIRFGVIVGLFVSSFGESLLAGHYPKMWWH
jgi:hypothetical protein